MDYSKIGFKFVHDVQRQAIRCGISVPESASPVQITPRLLNDCDTVVIQNRDNLKQLFDGKSLSDTAKELNHLGEIAHKFQKIFKYQKNTLSPQQLADYFENLKIGGLYRNLAEHGMDGLYTYLLNREAAGVTLESFAKLEEKLNKEIKTLSLDLPMVDSLEKGIIRQSDFDFTGYSKHGFVCPKNVSVPKSSDKAIQASKDYIRDWTYEERIPDGFLDGGRHMTFDASGRPGMGARELIIVDRKSDPKLRNVISQFKTILDRNPYLSYEERMNCLFTYVRKLFAEKDWRKGVSQFEDKTVNLGDIIYGGSGCCRHESMAAKVLADEVGLNMTIRRGLISDANGYNAGGHTWNEVYLPNGKKYVFDVAQWKLIDADSKDPFLMRYLKDGKRIYE